jgi:hypothetical protein
MGKFISIILIMISLLISSCQQDAQNQNNTNDSTKIANIDAAKNPNLKLQIYYFHATHRCPTCMSIENNVKQVLDNDYKGLISKGVIDFKVLCVDDEENKKLAEKFEAAGAALHLVKIENGREQDNDLTEFAFMYSRNEPDFFLKGISDTIQYFLK